MITSADKYTNVPVLICMNALVEAQVTNVCTYVGALEKLQQITLRVYQTPPEATCYKHNNFCATHHTAASMRVRLVVVICCILLYFRSLHLF